MVGKSQKGLINKIYFLMIASIFTTAVLLIRLFSLQVIQHDYFQNLAQAYQFGYTELPAQRGEIIITDYHSDEEFLLATNTNLKMLYADPTLIKDPSHVGNVVANLIFDIEDARAADNERILDISKKLGPELSQEEIDELLRPLSDTELEAEFKEDLISKISRRQREKIILNTEISNENAAKLNSLNIAGVEASEGVAYAYPPKIVNIASTAEKIAPLVEIPAKNLTTILKGENRYVVIKHRLEPEIAEAIEKLKKEDEEMFFGLGMREEYFRYYPEGSLAANIVGYVNKENVGQYGLESSFNNKLAGKSGKFQTKKDSVGRQITVGESVIENAVDGDNLVLTIDRSIQLKLEEILSRAVETYQADSGQAIIMNPQNGEIIALAHAPTFNPNNYGDVFRKIEMNLTPDEIKDLYPTKDDGIYYYYTNPVTLAKFIVFEEKDENGKSHYYRYENFVGPEVYLNKVVSWPYEPGSVFKSIAMSIAIDDGDVTPNTTYNDSGPIEVDYNVYTGKYDFEIKNSEGYYGLVNMTTVLGKSLNTGMTFVAKKIGPALFYSYLKKFGFLDRTDIEFDSESPGKIEYFEDWTESELATHAFGQGITINMIQLANAYSAIVNGGVLMQPHIVKEIRHDDGTVSTTEIREIRRVISEDTSSQMIEMLKKSVEEGVANAAKLDEHFVGGKTGTSQTYKYGRALSGKGTTITSFAGFGPINDPRFVVLIKFDHPKTVEWGSATAAPTFKELATYLFEYYNIPPDK